MAEKTQAELIEETKKKAIPKKGFRVVGVDSFSRPGEELYIVGDYETREEAETALAEAQEEARGDKIYIYTPSTR